MVRLAACAALLAAAGLPDPDAPPAVVARAESMTSSRSAMPRARTSAANRCRLRALPAAPSSTTSTPAELKPDSSALSSM